MTASTDTPGTPAGPLWTATAVARRLGVAPATLRSWSQRHGIGPAAHTHGRHRRYTATDIAELESIRTLVADGVALPAAAATVRAQRLPTGQTPAGQAPVGPGPDHDVRARHLGTGPPSATGAALPAVATRLAAAASGLDSATATDLVAIALAEHGVLTAWEQLCLPALHVLDAAVAEDRGCADSHLLLSRVLVTCLRRIPTAPGAHPVLLACAATEQHTLGLEALTAALAERRIPAGMLGATVPGAATLHAAAQLRPRAVVVWSQRPVTARAGLLRQLGAHTDTVLAAGPGWHPTRLPAAATRTEHLRTALALITATADTATPDPPPDTPPSAPLPTRASPGP